MVAASQTPRREVIATLERPLTEEDFWLLPDDENRYEIIGGELFVAPPPAAVHQNASQYLSVAIYNAVEVPRRGWVRVAPFGVRFSPTDIVQPDLFVLSRATSKGPRGKVITDLPVIVIEILSPSNRRNDLVKKRAQYQTFKVREYWIVDPINRTIDVLVLEGEEYVAVSNEGGIARSQSMPEVRIDIASVFSGDPFVPATTPSTIG